MKKIHLLFTLLIINFSAFTQIDATSENLSTEQQIELVKNLKESLKSEAVTSSCLCIDSIRVNKKDIKGITTEINSCIAKYTFSYDLGLALAETMGHPEKKEIKLNSEGKSSNYPELYKEVEKALMDSCKSIRVKIAANEVENEGSVSKNEKALKFYDEATKLYDKEDYAKAIPLYEKAVKEDKSFAFAWDNLGICYRKTNDFKKAIEAYKKSLEIDPTGLLPLQNIPIAYVYLKEYKKAISAYDDLAKVDKNNPEIYYGIGQIYYEYLHEYENSLNYICKAFNLYLEQKSPYRADAEQIIQLNFVAMKKENKENIFYEILQKNNISINKK